MEFTAVYNTEKLRGVEYYFTAKDIDSAIRFCLAKFSAKNIYVHNHTEPSTGQYHIGDHRTTYALRRLYLKKHNLI